MHFKEWHFSKYLYEKTTCYKWHLDEKIKFCIKWVLNWKKCWKFVFCHSLKLQSATEVVKNIQYVNQRRSRQLVSISVAQDSTLYYHKTFIFIFFLFLLSKEKTKMHSNLGEAWIYEDLTLQAKKMQHGRPVVFFCWLFTESRGI